MPRGKKAAASAAVFDGLVFCLSGAFTQKQKDLQQLIEDNGGTVAGSVTAKVTHLVSSAGFDSLKVRTATSKALPIVTEQWVQDSVDGGIVSSKTDSTHRLDAAAGASSAAVVAPGGKARGKKAAASAPAAAPAPAAAAAASGSRRRKAPAATADADDGDDQEVKKPAKRGAKKSKADPAPDPVATVSAPAPPKSAPKSVATMVKKGSAAVDPVCPKAATFHVYEDSTGVYDACLNQTNIGNNNNKFYYIQLIQSDDNSKYYCWTRWGRVGEYGQNATLGGGDLASAKRAFEEKFRDKTRNSWSDRKSFKRYPDKYQLLERDYGDDSAMDTDEKKEPEKTPDSTLDPRVQALISLICDVKMMRNSVIQIGYDPEQMPLGKLSRSTIMQGYSVLKRIESVLERKSSENFENLSNEFYSLIPHKTSGRTRPPVIRTADHLKEKLHMCEALADIQIAMTLLSAGSKSDENPIDSHYKKLKCGMQAIDRGSTEWKLVQKYVTNTHAATHRDYSLEIQDIYSLEREGEHKRFTPHTKTPNRMLLWHGSRLTNFVGILSQGLRIAPPEAPVTGYMFGKGVYFADMVSKSANYCFTNRDNNVGCLLLCEVALGSMNELFQADYYADKLPAGKLSTKGCGGNAPNPSEFVTLADGLVVPCGTATKTDARGALLYNEFIVYDTAQIKIKYLIKMKFNHAR